MAKRINKKHFIIYNNGGVICATTPKDWARANQSIFPKYDFSSDVKTPNVLTIEKYLSKIGFYLVENNDVVIYYQYKSI